MFATLCKRRAPGKQVTLQYQERRMPGSRSILRKAAERFSRALVASAPNNSEPSEVARQVSEYWGTDRRKARPVSWLEHPVALASIWQRVSGDPTVGTYEYWRRRFFSQPAPLCLSIGCGFGNFEREMVQCGAADRFHAHDLSKGAIKSARRAAAEAGLSDRIDYHVTDLNKLTVKSNAYDAIFGISSVHHIFELEPLFEQCRQGLKEGGLLFLDEYVGPSRFQSPPLAVKLINEFLDILPDSYRRNALQEGAVRGAYQNSSIEVFKANDPSEAVRSAEIVPTLKLYFDIVDYKPYGGAILHMLLSGLAGNFDENNPTDVALLRAMYLLETTLEEMGALGTDFAAIVAKPKT